MLLLWFNNGKLISMETSFATLEIILDWEIVDIVCLFSFSYTSPHTSCDDGS